MTNSMYCTASHKDSGLGCYELDGHDGQHRGYALFADDPFYWGEGGVATVPADFTVEELAVLLVAMRPVASFFPDLETKLTRMKEALK